jgi:hypothetical protein
MHESLVNQEDARLPENCKGREENPNWSRRKDGNNSIVGSEPPTSWISPL